MAVLGAFTEQQGNSDTPANEHFSKKELVKNSFWAYRTVKRLFPIDSIGAWSQSFGC